MAVSSPHPTPRHPTPHRASSVRSSRRAAPSRRCAPRCCRPSWRWRRPRRTSSSTPTCEFFQASKKALLPAAFLDAPPPDPGAWERAPLGWVDWLVATLSDSYLPNHLNPTKPTAPIIMKVAAGLAAPPSTPARAYAATVAGGQTQQARPSASFSSSPIIAAGAVRVGLLRRSFLWGRVGVYDILM